MEVYPNRFIQPKSLLHAAFNDILTSIGPNT